MASENTVEIGFAADTSDFTSGTEQASASVMALAQNAVQAFATMTEAINALTVPTQEAASHMELYYQSMLDNASKTAEAQVGIERAMVAERKAIGDISASESLDQLRDLADREHAINLRRAGDQQAIAAASGNTAQLGEPQAQSLAETERYARQVIKLNTEAAQQSQQAWEQAFQPIGQAFDSAIDGMVRGTQALDQTVRRMAQNIVAEYANSATQSALHWAEGEARKTLATQAGNTARLTSTTGAATEGMAIEGAANKESVIGNAWSAAAAVYNNVAQIPYVGWVLAPAAAATAAAAVLAFGGSIPSAAGGWVVPNDTMAMVHQNEMILPAHLSQGLAGMIAGGQGGTGHTFNNTFHVNAGDGVSARQLPDIIVKTMTKAMRNGQFGTMRAS